MKLKTYLKRHGIKHGRVAEELGMSEAGLRWHVNAGLSNEMRMKIAAALTAILRRADRELTKLL